MAWFDFEIDNFYFMGGRKMKKLILLLILGLSFIFVTQNSIAQNISENIKGELIKDKQSNTVTYNNNELRCSFKVPDSWTLMAHDYNQQSVRILFARYNNVGAMILHGGENQFVMFMCYPGGLNKFSLEDFVKFFCSEIKQGLQSYNIRYLGQDTISINGNIAIRKAQIAGEGGKSVRSINYFFAKNNNIYLFKVDIAPENEEEGFYLPLELKKIVDTFQIR